MRTLVLAGEYPWPADSGSRLRLLTTLRGLRACGPVELCSVVPADRTDLGPPDPGLDLDRVELVTYDDRSPSTAGLVGRLAGSPLPLGLPRPGGHRVPAAVAAVAAGPYDLVWCFGPRAFVLAGRPALAPTVIDLDDLEDEKVRARRAASPPPRGLADRARAAVAAEEARRWRRLYRKLGREAAALVVCSELDAGRARRSGLGRVVVVPNGYPDVAAPVGREAVGADPVVLFCGTLRYPPNTDAAGWLAAEVGPRLRALVPGARLRLVGRTNRAVEGLHHPPAVTVVGPVPDITGELARADLVVVPLRFGSGTRLKILEAFAHRVPVVATPLGAEGLGVEDGVHLLLADDPDGLAEACRVLLTDVDRRRAVTAAAHDLLVDRFRAGSVEARAAAVAREAAGRPVPA